MTFHISGRKKSEFHFSKVFFSALSFSQSKKGNADRALSSMPSHPFFPSLPSMLKEASLESVEVALTQAPDID
jgi:hypothetical protein